MAYKVLIVDDESVDLEWLKRRMDAYSDRLEVAATANSGFQALALLQEHHFDMMFSDIRMPIMSGLELAAKARELQPQMKIAFISGHDDFAYAKQAIRIHAAAYLLKPVVDAELQELLSELTGQLDRERERSMADPLWGEVLPFAGIDELVEQLAEALHGYQLVAVDEHLERLFLKAEQLQAKSAVVSLVTYLLSRLAARCRRKHEAMYKESDWAFVKSRGLYEYDALYDLQSRIRRKLFELSETLYIRSMGQGRKMTQAIKEYVDAELENGISLKKTAAHFGFSPNYLGYLFREETGGHFSDYLVQARLDRACRLLLDPTLKVYEICGRIGYKNVLYFNRQFKKYKGMTPSEYRKRHKV